MLECAKSSKSSCLSLYLQSNEQRKISLLHCRIICNQSNGVAFGSNSLKNYISAPINLMNLKFKVWMSKRKNFMRSLYICKIPSFLRIDKATWNSQNSHLNRWVLDLLHFQVAMTWIEVKDEFFQNEYNGWEQGKIKK